MKKLFLSIFGIFILLICCTQNATAQVLDVSKNYKVEQLDSLMKIFFDAHFSDVLSPKDVIAQNFKKTFPNASDIDWESFRNFYKVEFEIKNTDYDALYDAKGNLLMYRFDITRSAVPKQIKDAVKSNALYKGYHIDDAETVVTAYGVKYKVVMEKGETEIRLLFNEDGSLMK